jgi:hypothetical protein
MANQKTLILNFEKLAWGCEDSSPAEQAMKKILSAEPQH